MMINLDISNSIMNFNKCIVVYATILAIMNMSNISTVNASGDICHVLSLSGGGAHGAYQAGVLKKLNEEGHQWDVITGVSVGSLNGLMIALYNQTDQNLAIDQMENMWMKITSDMIYKWNWDPIYDQSLYTTQPMNDTISQTIFENGGKTNRPFIVGSVRMNTGLMELFNYQNYTKLNDMTTIVMASAAIPVAFPPIKFNGNYYVDGGTYNNELVGPGIQYCLQQGKTDIQIDMIMCSAPIQNLTSAEISKLTIIGATTRAYDIVSNSMTNHEIYTNCANSQSKFPMYLYKHDVPFEYGLLDFSHKAIHSMFEIGYNSSVPQKTHYCY